MKTRYFNFKAFLLIFICLGCESQPSGNELCNDYSLESPPTIPVNLIYEMVDNYNYNQRSAINRSEHLRPSYGKDSLFDDTQVVWLNLETLKKFIYHIEAETLKADPSIKKEDLGIHIYFGSYPKQIEWEKETYNGALLSVPRNYARRHSIIMTPTINVKNEPVSFNPLDFNTFQNGILEEDHNYQRISNKKILSLNLISAKEGELAQNHGGLFPPGDTNNIRFLND
ncbi:hypothetical protein ACJD0Z_08300 [Flavobacteriaceae bacterium M23B6Z8]